MPDNTTTHPSAASTPFSPIEDIVEDIRDGKMVIMVDDENRENEGDLIMAAAKVRPEDINYMATHGRGLICLTMERERCKQLRLPLMVSDTDQHHATNFTISIEAAEGITTGISAHDRAKTIQAAVAPDAKPEHLSQPGHIFPVMAQSGRRAIVSSGFRISTMAAQGSRPARRARSQPASVCPARVRTPPDCAMTGKMCPGWLRCSGVASGATAAWIVFARSCAEMPVVIPSAASIEIVKLVA